MIEVHFLPAKNGDALFLHCKKGNEEGWIIVDGGPSQNAKFNPFIKEIEDLPSLDLIVMTHQDDDHLVGIMAYINAHRGDESFPTKRLWVNCSKNMDMPGSGDLSPKKARKLADVLSEIAQRQEISWVNYITEGYNDDSIMFADIIVLNPTEDMIQRFISAYEEKAGVKNEKAGSNLRADRIDKDFEICLEALSKREKEKPSEQNYHQFANMVSIAFIIKCDEMCGLMLGDSFPDEIVNALRRRGYSKDNKLKVDFMKVAHHGSRHNISNELLDMIDCHNYLISTNGGAANTYHPDREALANILCHDGRDDRTVHLFFNYKLSEIEANKHFRLFHEGEYEKYNFVIHEPNEETKRNKYRVSFD